MTTVEGEVVEQGLARQSSALAVEDALTIEQLVAQVQTIQQAMKSVMHDNEHYGVIPGTNKPTLLKPGAEKLCLLFRLAPAYRTEKTWHDDGHLTVEAVCSLKHINTGNLIAEGEGLCTTKEAKYAYRRGERICPECEKPAIIKGRKEYGGGWVCFKKKDGCGAKWPDGAEVIESQETGRIPNEDLADSYNTVLKISCKRALIAAVLNGTAASDIFTQDIGDDEVVEPQKGGDVSQGSSEHDRAVQETGSGVDKAAPQTIGGSTAPATSPGGDPEGSQGAPGSSSWELIEGAVEAGLRKKTDVLRKASGIVLHRKLNVTVDWDSLPDHVEIHDDLVRELGLQDTLV